MPNWNADVADMYLTPARRRGFEHLDDPATDDALRARSMRDVRMSNILLGGGAAVLTELSGMFTVADEDLTLLDVGTGLADIPLRAKARARELGVRLQTIGLDGALTLAMAAGKSLDSAICGDARSLPLADRSIDVVVCSQVLHHFESEDVRRVISELHRVARKRVIVSDLRRSWIAAGGFWMVSWPLGFHPVTRHDGTTSVLRGFTARELGEHVRSATGVAPEIRRRPGYRLTATWTRAGE